MSPRPRDKSAEDQSVQTNRIPNQSADPAHADAGTRTLRHFSHRCRNTLNGIKLGLYLLKKQLDVESSSRWNELGRTCDEIERLFDRVQRIYQSSKLTVVRSPLGQLFAERLPSWRSRFAVCGRRILVNPPEHEIPGDFDPTHLGFGFDAFVAWRAGCIDAGEPRLAWRVADGEFEISWQECPVQPSDGHFHCDRSSTGAPPFDCTSSMAILLLARVAADHNGELKVRSEPSIEVTIRWPQFRESTPSQ